MAALLWSFLVVNSSPRKVIILISMNIHTEIIDLLLSAPKIVRVSNVKLENINKLLLIV